MTKMELEIVNPHCAGIDVGSRSHFVAVGQALEDVKEFGVYADDLTEICLHLSQRLTSETTWNYICGNGIDWQLLAKPLC